MEVFFYNTLTRQKEKFEPLDPRQVRIYTCGPTVYYFPHIGNWRTFVLGDLLRRVLRYNGYKIKQVMNLTDVGHLTGDNLGHADLGEDRLEKAARQEGRSVWQVAEGYIDDFVSSRSLVHIEPPEHLVRATEYLPEQIRLVKRLVEKGYAYETATGVFFEVDKFKDYGKLGGQKLIDKKVAVREEVEEDATKKNPADFALWLKTVGKFADHSLKWASPWGEGFPGWHLECSALAMKFLGETLDLHVGGVDHIAIHHTNEIAQSEALSGKTFSRFWIHGEFLLVDGGRMGKSLGNAYTLHDLLGKGFNPLALRYFYFSAHYRQQLNFTWEALAAAQTALNRLTAVFDESRSSQQPPDPGSEYDNGGLPGPVRSTSHGKARAKPLIGCAEYEQKFLAAVNDDLDLPKALSLVWDLVKSGYPVEVKKASLLKFDEVLGLGLGKVEREQVVLPDGVGQLLSQREAARQAGDFSRADDLRRQLLALGFGVEDTQAGPKVSRK